MNEVKQEVEPESDNPEEMEESQSVARFRGVDRYANMEQIYKIPAIKRYGGKLEEFNSTAPKKIVSERTSTKQEPQESNEATLFGN